MQTVCIYAKPPIPGRTKSRLARDIGDVPAAELASAILQDIVQVTSGAPNTTLEIWHPPDSLPSDFPKAIAQDLTLKAQQGDFLGTRMANTIRTALRSADAVLILGSDCPTHSADSIQQAFDELTTASLVFQPAADGGYVLVGASEFHSEPFVDTIEWGTSSVMAQTRNALYQSATTWSELPETFDVDRASDLPLLAQFCRSHDRPHSSRWLAQHPDLIPPIVPAADGNRP